MTDKSHFYGQDMGYLAGYVISLSVRGYVCGKYPRSFKSRWIWGKFMPNPRNTSPSMTSTGVTNRPMICFSSSMYAGLVVTSFSV